MQLTVTVLIAAALLAGPETDTPPAAAPTTIGMYTNYLYGWARDDAPVDYVLMPVAAYTEGKWLPSAFFAMKTPENQNTLAETFRPEQDTFLDALMTQTFYLCKNPKVTFTPEKKKIPWKVEQQYIGLAGTLNGKIEEEEEYFDLAMTNVPEVSAALENAELSAEDKVFYSKRLKELITTAVIAWESKHPQEDQRPSFNPERYQLPEYATVLKFKLPGGWEGLWLHVTLAYPLEASPPTFGFYERSVWSGYYNALIEVQPASKSRVLWEYASFLGWESGNRYYELKGVFDADKNNKPEFLLDIGGWEYGSYLLAYAEKGELIKISSVSGAL